MFSGNAILTFAWYILPKKHPTLKLSSKQQWLKSVL
jgi:hypothetical protein